MALEPIKYYDPNSVAADSGMPAQFGVSTNTSLTSNQRKFGSRNILIILFAIVIGISLAGIIFKLYFAGNDTNQNPVGTSCAINDLDCLRAAVKRATPEQGVNACLALPLDELANCVKIYAWDSLEPDDCDPLKDEEKSSCLDTLYLIKANKESAPNLCDKISNPLKRSSCEKPDAVTSPEVLTALEEGNPDSCKELTSTDSIACQELYNDTDRDQDGLSLREEFVLKTSDKQADFDNDGLKDGEEVYNYKTNPTNPDSDGDSYLDGEEVQNGYNPNQ